MITKHLLRSAFNFALGQAEHNCALFNGRCQNHTVLIIFMNPVIIINGQADFGPVSFGSVMNIHMMKVLSCSK